MTETIPKTTNDLAKDARRKQLLDAAFQAFGKKGYHGAQVSDIIQEAGVARGTFYLYFTSKREAFEAVLNAIFERVHSQVQSLPRHEVAKIPEQIKGNLTRITHLLLQEPLLVKILLAESIGIDPEREEQLAKFYKQLLELTSKSIRQGQEMGFVRQGDPLLMAIALLGAIKEIFFQSLLGTELPSEGIIVDEIYAFVLNALKGF